MLTVKRRSTPKLIARFCRRARATAASSEPLSCCTSTRQRPKSSPGPAPARSSVSSVRRRAPCLPPRTVGSRWTGWTSEEECLIADTEKGRRCIGAGRIDRRVRIGADRERWTDRPAAVTATRYTSPSTCVKCRDASSGSICSRMYGMFSSMMVKPNTGVTVCGPSVGRAGTTRLRNGTRMSESSPRRTGRRSNTRARLEVAEFLFDLARHFSSGWPPLGGFECVDVSVPSPESKVTVVGIHHEHVGNDLRMTGGIQPGVVTIGVPFGYAFAYSGRTDLQAQGRANELTVETFTELGSRDADVALQTLPGGGAQLADPLVLQNGERRQEDQQSRRHERRPRWFLELHRANVSMHKSP